VSELYVKGVVCDTQRAKLLFDVCFATKLRIDKNWTVPNFFHKLWGNGYNIVYINECLGRITTSLVCVVILRSACARRAVNLKTWLELCAWNTNSFVVESDAVETMHTIDNVREVVAFDVHNFSSVQLQGLGYEIINVFEYFCFVVECVCCCCSI